MAGLVVVLRLRLAVEDGALLGGVAGVADAGGAAAGVDGLRDEDQQRDGANDGENGFECGFLFGHFWVLVFGFREATRPPTHIVGAGATRAKRLRLRARASARAD